ncbi:MAG TPA: hypothetical protein VEZ90_18240 [Blastocatellia bacterium]|nr:hypothetical protein [Blastocatellia bacterium]
MKLDEYVRKVMKEKGFTAYQVQKNSDGAIKDSYVARLADGTSKFPSVLKLKDLAKGLQVDFVELIMVAAGSEPTGGWTPQSLAEAMVKIARGEELTQAVKILVRMKPEELKHVLIYLNRKRHG